MSTGVQGSVQLAVLSNPRSRAGHARAAQIATLADLHGVEHHLAVGLDGLAAQLRDILASKPALLAVNGGDGSLQAVLTTLLTGGFEDIPPLCALPGGSTNMSAGDLGWRGSLRAALPRLLALRDLPREQWPLQQRPVLELRSEDGGFHAGLFFGIGTIVRGAEYWQRELRANGHRGEWAAGAVLLRGAWGLWRRQPPFADATRVRLAADDAAAAELEVSLLLVTVMRRLFLGLTPFWGGGDAPLACTWLDDRPQRLWQRLPALLRGRAAQMRAEEGYHSCRGHRFRLDLDEVWLLDGELHAGGGQIELGASRPLAFVDLGQVPA